MKASIDNSFYDQLNDNWYEADNHPIAILRAEQKIKNPWIINSIDEHFKGETNLSILDIGCGGGFLTNDLITKYSRVTGIDLSESSLEVAKTKDRTGKVEYLSANAYNLPFLNQSMDVVCAMDFLEHVDNPESVIKEASRILKPGGQFFFHTFNRNFISWLVVIKCMEWFMPNTPKNLHVIDLFIKPQELENLLLKYSLSPIVWTGIRPRLDIHFFKSFLTRMVSQEFSFRTTNSLAMGYMGHAIKSD